MWTVDVMSNSLHVSNKLLRVYFIGITLFSCLCVLLPPLPSFQNLGQRYFAPEPMVLGPCAINLYGLPRSFKASVLPSLIRNVIRPNVLYKCDYFLHFDNSGFDRFNGRSDRVGHINPLDVHLLTKAVHEEYRKEGLAPPRVLFSNTTAEEFQQTYEKLLQKIYDDKDEQGNPVYLPLNHKSYTFSTIENVIKMWHSQEAVWNLMESQSDKHYSRVAMLRSDVVYVTPIDIYELGDYKKKWDYQNTEAVVPLFARFPVNDRMIYGPYDAVKIWATGRFARLNLHIAHVQKHAPGDGLHSERFLQYTIFPAIRQAGVNITMKHGLCFLRVRADHSVRLSDCGKLHVTHNNHKAVETILGRTCVQNWTLIRPKNLVQLECPVTAKAAVGPEVKWHSGCNPNLSVTAPVGSKHRRKPILFFLQKPTPAPTRHPCIQEHISLMIQWENENATLTKP